MADKHKEATEVGINTTTNALTALPTTFPNTLVRPHSALVSTPSWDITDNFLVQDDQDLFQEALIPPENFNMVCQHVYRSSFPKKKHFQFLKKLQLKSVLTLILEEYPEQNMIFLEEQGIKFLQFGIAGNKEPFVQIPEDKISAALAAILGEILRPTIHSMTHAKEQTSEIIQCWFI
ncbi:hypothetical protein DFQ29_000541, partial [Apophysomyces sp. BC1021]